MIELPFETNFIILLAAASLGLGLATFLLFILNRFRRTARRVRRKRVRRIGLSQNLFRFITLVLWIAVSAAILFFAAFVQSYRNFTREALVAEIRCRPIENSASEMSIELTPIVAGSRHPPSRFQLHGDQWALEGDILKWEDWLNFLGLHTMFKLTRLRGRYVNYADEIEKRSTVYSLVEHEEDPRWRWLYEYGHKLPFVSAVYGNTVFTYPSEEKLYRVYASTSGFVIRVHEN